MPAYIPVPKIMSIVYLMSFIVILNIFAIFFQVRDVLKGILKPSNLFNSEEIQIRDNYYKEELPMSSSADLTPSSQNSKMSPATYDARRGRGAFDPTSSVDTSSDPDSSSPEYSDNTYVRRDSKPKRDQRAEIELIDWESDPGHRSLSRQSSTSSVGSSRRRSFGEGGGAGSPRSVRPGHEGNTQWTFGSRNHRIGGHSDSESNDIFDSNQNMNHRLKGRRRSDDGIHNMGY